MHIQFKRRYFVQQSDIPKTEYWQNGPRLAKIKLQLH